MKHPSLLSFVVLGLLLSLVLPAAAQGIERPPAPDRRDHATAVPGSAPAPAQPSFHDEALMRGPAAATAASAVSLGQPGLSYRYNRTYGVSEQAYISDTQHLNGPSGIFIDGLDSVYVAEEAGSRLIRYNSGGSVTRVIGQAGLAVRGSYTLDQPRDVALDPAGNIWLVDSNRVAEYSAAGAFLQEWPPNDPWQSGSDANHFDWPVGIAFDSTGRLFVSDTNNQRIQVFTFSGGHPVLQDTIGVPGQTGNDNSHFAWPLRIAVDSADRLYVADAGNGRVQRCSQAGTWSCTPFAGGLNQPQGLTVDAAGNVYIANTGDYRIRKCNSSGSCSDAATVTNWTTDVAVDSTGKIYGATVSAHAIRLYSASGGGLMGTFAGVDEVPYLSDNAHFNKPHVAVDAAGRLYVAEEWGYRLLKLGRDGAPAWPPIGKPGVDANHGGSFFGAQAVAVDGNGTIFVGDDCRLRIFSGAGQPLAGLGGACGQGNDLFGQVGGVAVAASGNIYVADSDRHVVQVYNSAHTLVGHLGQPGSCGNDQSHFCRPRGLAVDHAGNIYVADSNNQRVQKFDGQGALLMSLGATSSSGRDFGRFGNPEDVAVDGQGRIFVADQWNNRVQVFDAAGGYLTSIGGSYGTRSGEFRGVSSVDVDEAGNVYIADTQSSRIEKFSPSVPGWLQSNLNGFGDPGNYRIGALAGFGTKLYAGTWSSSGSGAQLWRTANGRNWSAVVQNGFGQAQNDGVADLRAFKNQLYAALRSNSSGGGEIYRSSTGNAGDWSRVVALGFGDPTNGGVYRLEVFKDVLYAGTGSFTTAHGAEIWRSPSGDSGSWTKVLSNGLGNPTNMTIRSSAVFSGYLYFGADNWDTAAETTTGGSVFRSSSGDLGAWAQVNAAGFGEAANEAVTALAAFDGYLYALTLRADVAGVQVWRCQACDSAAGWQKVVDNGFGNARTNSPGALEVHDGQLYLLVGNGLTGMEVWRTRTGNAGAWQQVGLAGFGDSNNYWPYWDSALTTFNGALYAGTFNPANGSEVWEYLDQRLYLSTSRR